MSLRNAAGSGRYSEYPRREVDGAPESPRALIYRLLNSTNRRRLEEVSQAREQGRRAAERRHRQYADLALELTGALHEMNGLLDRHAEVFREAEGAEAGDVLGALQRRLVKTLESTGGRILDPVGEPYLAVAEFTEVKDRPADTEDAELVVSKTLRPGLLHEGELLRRAEVFLALPVEADPASPAAEAGQAPPAEAVGAPKTGTGQGEPGAAPGPRDGRPGEGEAPAQPPRHDEPSPPAEERPEPTAEPSTLEEEAER